MTRYNIYDLCVGTVEDGSVGFFSSDPGALSAAEAPKYLKMAALDYQIRLAEESYAREPDPAVLDVIRYYAQEMKRIGAIL